MSINSLTISPEGGLARYLGEIRRFPVLSSDEEQMHANRWYYHQDTVSAQALITSHLRLVAKVAMGYRGYGLPLTDLISEGNIGLMQAVKKFNPERGFRLSTYALWWIKASIHEFILRSWSLVKIGTTAAQKKLFFNLRKLKNRMSAYESGDLTTEQTQKIAKQLDVTAEEVTDMNRRMMGGDHSLNAPLRDDQGNPTEWQDLLVDQTPNQEEFLVEQDEMEKRRIALSQALGTLKDRERQIFMDRRLTDPVKTLEELSITHGISRERIRQIESRAYEKVVSYLQSNGTAQLMGPAS